MAQQTKILLIDDVDGAAADETVTFGVDGVSYEIDLTAERASELRDAFATWVGHARKVGGRSSSRASSRASGSRRSSDAGSVREWAKQNGYEVSERGRISAEIRVAYEAATR